MIKFIFKSLIFIGAAYCALAFIGVGISSHSYNGVGNQSVAAETVQNLVFSVEDYNESNQKVVAVKKVEAAGVTIVWTSDFAVNCGAKASKNGLGGCFRPVEPNKIFVSPDMGALSTEYIVLHEYAHYVQFSQGVPLNECEADQEAVKMGADPQHAHYAKECSF